LAATGFAGTLQRRDLRQVGRDHDDRPALVGEAGDENLDLDDRADLCAARGQVEDDEL